MEAFRNLPGIFFSHFVTGVTLNVMFMLHPGCYRQYFYVSSLLKLQTFVNVPQMKLTSATMHTSI